LTLYSVRSRMCFMKQCPQCSAEYSDNIGFCPNDGKSLVAKTTARKQLCPYCANSIEEDTTSCPYCKADLLSQFVPQWLKRDESSSEPRVASERKGFSIPGKFIWIAVLLVTGLATFLIGGRLQRAQLLQSSQDSVKELQAKDQMIQSLEKQLDQTRQEFKENSNQLAEAKAKLEESQKNLSTTQQRLDSARREADRLSASQSQARTRTVSRPAEPLPTTPPAAPRRAAESGVYETTRATTVYEDPSPSARVVSQIGKGTRINVVGSAGDWLEVRSKRGNPPGFVRSDDARLVGRAN
jgi:SH3 domain-containing protein